jgi:hypothetical protein
MQREQSSEKFIPINLICKKNSLSSHSPELRISHSPPLLHRAKFHRDTRRSLSEPSAAMENLV